MCRITVSRPHCYGCCQPLISGDLVGLEYCGEARDTQTPLNPLGSCGRDLTELTILDVESYCPGVPPVRTDGAGSPPQLAGGLACSTTGDLSFPTAESISCSTAEGISCSTLEGISCSTAGWVKLRRALADIERGWGNERWEEAVVEFLLQLADDPRLFLDPSGAASITAGEQPQQTHGEFFLSTAGNKIAFLRAINNELEFTDALGGDADADYEQRLVRYWYELQFHKCRSGHSSDAATTIPESP